MYLIFFKRASLATEHEIAFRVSQDLFFFFVVILQQPADWEITT